MVARFCTNCGAPTEPGATFCAKCGSRLTPGTPPPAPTTVTLPYQSPPYAAPPYTPPGAYAPQPAYVTPTGPYGYPGYPYAPPVVDYAAMERQKRIDRTKLGLLFLTIGFVLVWVPYVGAIAYLLFLIGAILAILGRHPFGGRHALYVVISVVVFIVGLVVVGIGLLIAAFQLLLAVRAGNVAAAAAAVRSEVVWGVAGSAVLGISYVLFVHELENPTGRYLLYAGYAAAIGTGAVLVFLTDAALGNLAALRMSDVDAVSNQLVAWRLLEGVSSLLFAGAYYIAYSRVQRKEIPAPPGVTPPMPTAPAAPMLFPQPPTAAPPIPAAPMSPTGPGPPTPPATPPNP